MLSDILYGSVSVRLAVVVPVHRARCKAVRKCKRGYEFGYYLTPEDGPRVFVRVGLSRTYTLAMRWLEIV